MVSVIQSAFEKPRRLVFCDHWACFFSLLLLPLSDDDPVTVVPSLTVGGLERELVTVGTRLGLFTLFSLVWRSIFTIKPYSKPGVSLFFEPKEREAKFGTFLAGRFFSINHFQQENVSITGPTLFISRIH